MPVCQFLFSFITTFNITNLAIILLYCQIPDYPNNNHNKKKKMCQRYKKDEQLVLFRNNLKQKAMNMTWADDRV